MVNYRAVARKYAPKELIDLYRLLRNKFQRPDPWITSIKSLFQRDIQQKLGKNNLGNSAKTIFFWTPFAPWPHMLIEYSIATNLRLRGHKVLFFVCDGNLPHCEMERGNFARIDCESCWSKSQSVLDAFSLPYQKVSDFVSLQEIKNITNNVMNLSENAAQNYIQNSIELGHYSFEYLTTYFQGPVLDYGEKEKKIFRRVLIGNAIAQIYSQRILEKRKPDLIVMINGHSCQTYPAFATFKNEKIPLITWEDYAFYPDAFIFMQNKSIHETDFDDELWFRIKNQVLNEEQEAKVNSFLKDWPDGNLNDIVYHPQPIKSINKIKNKIGLQDNKHIFVAFTNLVWDTAALGQNVGFDGMMDWLYKLCEWFIIHPEKQLIIRVHPAEKRLPPNLRTENGVSSLIHSKFKEKLEQSNIFIVDAEDDIYSYSLAEIADAVGVYTTTLGMELASVGIKPWVAGKVHYRNKGFTLDIKNASHLYEELEKVTWVRSNSEEEKMIARRYCYARIERQIVQIPFLKRIETAYTKLPYFRDLKFLIPGNDPLIDTLADRILDGQPFIDIPKTSNINFTSH